jgi:hypothetical protein
MLGTHKTPTGPKTRWVSLTCPLYFSPRCINAFSERSEEESNKSGGAKGNEPRDRLSKVAREVTRKEMVVLEEAGKSFERIVDFDDLVRNPGGIPPEPAMLTLNKVERDFALVVKK